MLCVYVCVSVANVCPSCWHHIASPSRRIPSKNDLEKALSRGRIEISDNPEIDECTALAPHGEGDSLQLFPSHRSPSPCALALNTLFPRRKMMSTEAGGARASGEKKNHIILNGLWETLPLCQNHNFSPSHGALIERRAASSPNVCGVGDKAKNEGKRR